MRPVADIADVADGSIELHLAESLRKQVGKSAPESHPNFDGLHCLDCDDEIPPARLALKRIRCVLCQGLLERRRILGLGS